MCAEGVGLKRSITELTLPPSVVQKQDLVPCSPGNCEFGVEYSGNAQDLLRKPSPENSYLVPTRATAEDRDEQADVCTDGIFPSETETARLPVLC